MRRSPLPLAAILSIAAVGTTGCGLGSLGNDAVQTALSQAGGGGMGDPAVLLLRQDDLAGINGVSTALREQPTPQVPDLGAPDPTAPCGAATPPLRLDPKAVRVFATDDGTRYIVEALFDLPPGQAQSVIDANREDMRPGCAPVHSIAPAAERVTSFDGQAVLYDTTGDDRVAFTSTVTDAEGMTWYTVTSLVRVADVLLFLKAMSTEPILESMMRELTLRAAEKVEAIR